MAGHLTARKVETAKPGKYGDGANLYLVVSKTGARKWVLRFTWHGKPEGDGPRQPSMFRSPTPAIEPPLHTGKKIAQGINPIEARKRAKRHSVFRRSGR